MRIIISIDEDLLREFDKLVKRRIFASRSEAIQVAIKEKLSRLSKSRLADECFKLNPKFEQAPAEHPESIVDV